EDDVELAADLPLPHDRLAGLVVLHVEPLVLEDLELRDVAREEEIERPVERDAELADEAGQLREIDRAPHEPCDEAGELHAEDLGDRASLPERCEDAERLEG